MQTSGMKEHDPDENSNSQHNGKRIEKINVYQVQKSDGIKKWLTLEELAEQIDELQNQEFMMTIPIGGVPDDR